MSVCYSTSVADAIANKYDLSKVHKEKYRFIDLQKYLETHTFSVVEFDEEVDSSGKPIPGGVPPQAQPYAAISYPWRDLNALPGTDPSKDAFATVGTSDTEPLTSDDVLVTISAAARQEGCKYLWMDKLCFRQDYDQDGIDDRAWQMKRMYSIYEKCKICLVAAGGMVRLPRLIDRTVWINRAWTLQEALAPPEVKCLFSWNSGDKTIETGSMSSTVQKVLPGTAMAPLPFLLAANLHADTPTKTKVKDKNGTLVDQFDLPSDPDSQVYLFGYGNEDIHPITALQGALERPKPEEPVDGNIEAKLSGRRLGIWRCITMRSARYAEDFVFATMGIFGVPVDPLIDPKTNQIRKEGYPEDEIQELLDQFLGALSQHGSRADWFAVAPELGPARETTALPLVPDINFAKDSSGRLATPVKELLKYWDGFNWYLKDALKYKVDAPNGIQVAGLSHHIAFAGVLPAQDPPRSKLIRRHDGIEFEVTDGGDRDRHALVIGRKARYTGASFPPLTGDKDEALLMLIEYIPFTQSRYRNIGYAWAPEGLVDGWTTSSFGLGLRGG